MANKALAFALGIAPETAKNHVYNAMAKVDAQSRLQLFAWAMAHGFGPPGRAAALAAAPDGPPA